MEIKTNRLILDVKRDSWGWYGFLFSTTNKANNKWINVNDVDYEQSLL